MLSPPSAKIGCDFLKEKQFALTNDFSAFESGLHGTKYSITEYVGEWTLMKFQS